MVQPNGLTRNLLLQSLDPEDFAFLAQHLERTTLDPDRVIVSAGDRIESVCFPENGVTSITDIFADGSRIEVGLVGREGMTNTGALLFCKRAPHDAVVLIGGGPAMRVSADRLRELCLRSPHAQGVFLRFVQSFMIQIARTLASNLRDSATRRLARWLLMCHDRIDGDEIRLIHGTLGQLLSVRRATVTDALHILEGNGAITARRCSIVIRDRQKLEAIAGESYGFAEAHYRRLIGSDAAKHLDHALPVDPVPLATAAATVGGPMRNLDLAQRAS